MSNSVYKVIAPLAGTYYEAPSPEEPPYVRIGQQVNSGDVVCLIESMKVFTELRTEKAGVIKQILVEDEDPVLKNQELMEIEMV